MNDFSGMLRDGIDGSLSSRRVVTFLAFLLCALGYVLNLFCDMKVEKFMFDAMAYIAMAGLGATVAEKFSSAEKFSVVDRDRYDYERSSPYSQPTYPRRGTRLPRQEDPLI